MADRRAAEDIKRKLSALQTADLSHAGFYETWDFHAKGFEELGRYANRIDDPDMARTALYCAFQPLYDALLADGFAGGRRKTALVLLDTLTAAGVSFLTGYYTGNADARIVSGWLESSDKGLRELKGSTYSRRPRNLDYPDIIKPSDIAAFLKKAAEAFSSPDAPLPDYVVGCACGSSEVAMPLAGILECDVGFARFSNQRRDREAMVIAEHEPGIREGVEGKHALCAEDVVVTGETLCRVMERIESYRPSWLVGASVIYKNEDLEMIGCVTENPGFHTFRPRVNAANAGR